MPITYNETGVVYDSTIYTWDGERYQPTVFPIAGIFVAWDDGPYVANPVWTEVTTDVRRFSIHRGRSSDFDQFEAGTAQITFDNRNRKYDPFYTSGSLYGKLLPRRQVRVTAQIGGVLYEVFRGFIAGWPVTWSEYGKDSTVTVQCFDALGLMVNEQVPTDWIDYYTRTLSPRRYWKANDSRTSRAFRESSGTLPQLNMAANSAATNPFETDPNGLGLVGNSTNLITGGYWTTTGAAGVSTARDYSLSFWLQIYPGNQETRVEYYRDGSFIVFSYTPSGGTTCQIANQTAQRTYTLPNLVVNANYHVVVASTANSGGTPTAVFYQNGATWTPSSNVSGAVSYTPWTEFGQILGCQIQEVAAFDSTLTATQVSTLYAYGSARLSETTSVRMDRILGTTLWPAALESFPAAPVGTVAEIGSGNGVIAELQLVADSEGGEMYVAKNGVLTMTARRDVFNATRSKNVQATITDSGAGVRYGSEVEIMYDADNLKNDITVNFSGDGEVGQTNAVTIAAYGANAAIIETQLDSPTSATDLATLELGVEGVLVPQVSPLDVSANTAAADWQAILGLELLDRVNFKRTPTVGNQFSRDALINAIDHQVEPGQWRTQLTLSMRYTSPLTLNDSVLGRVDYNYLG